MANKPKNQTKQIHNMIINPQKTDKPPSWTSMKALFTPKKQQQMQKQVKQEHVRKQKKQTNNTNINEETSSSSKKFKKMKCSGSLCSNTKVTYRPPETTTVSSSSLSPEGHHKKRVLVSDLNTCSRSSSIKPRPLHDLNGRSGSSRGSSTRVVSSTTLSVSSTNNVPFKGIPFRRFSGCYECKMVVDPVLGFTRETSLRETICSCPQCGEIFMKAEYLELHLATRHAVSELGAEDTSKNIVEIIFQSSWLKKETPICKIDRILKVHNTQKTITKFEEYRDSIKSKANKFSKKHPRCIADGNELLRFHCTSFTCSLGLNGSSHLCDSNHQCNVCGIIKNGFNKVTQEGFDFEKGILTTATSGKAHDKAEEAVVNTEEGDKVKKRAMLVCRVIAGRVLKKNTTMDDGYNSCLVEKYDSMAGAVGLYSNLDELFVLNPKAILPCFVVIYTGF